MYSKSENSWIKHIDFTLIDIICLQISYIAAYMIRHGFSSPYDLPLYRRMAVILFFLNVFVASFRSSYSGILRRGYYEEAVAVVTHVTMVFAVALAYLFLLQQSADYSRITFLLTWMINIVLTWIARILRKLMLMQRKAVKEGKRSMVVITSSDIAEAVVKTFKNSYLGDIRMSGLAIMDKDMCGQEYLGVPVMMNQDNILEYLKTNWVDEVFIDVSGLLQETAISDELLAKCLEMGITVHTKLAKIAEMSKNQVVENLAGYTVLSSSVALVTPGQILAKRGMDIVGGLLGCVITAVLFLFIAPIILIKSPGPVFFSQIRVGKNGKQFRIFKFRSMYLDAEKRKEDLMAQNKMKDGFMFKMDKDPRIIRGIGSFIRKYSIDEFPQFFNVLKGDMSLVGTRPPTTDEWEKYELHHRKRLAIKPGLTGMWQVSGRSNITDFEEVVALDSKYISEWSLGLDLRILLKTIKVIFSKEGSV